jgi:Ca2+-binding EF-hand superfamily protein
MPILYNNNNDIIKLRHSLKSKNTNILLKINNKKIKLTKKSNEKSYILTIYDFNKNVKLKLIKLIKVLTNANIKLISNELNNLPLTISDVNYNDIFKIEQILIKLQIKYLIT